MRELLSREAESRWSELGTFIQKWKRFPVAAEARVSLEQEGRQAREQAEALAKRHLLSHDQNGIEIQTYCAIIACMLISLWTGKKPTLRTYETICFYFCGLADEDELMAHIKNSRPSPFLATRLNRADLCRTVGK